MDSTLAFARREPLPAGPGAWLHSQAGGSWNRRVGVGPYAGCLDADGYRIWTRAGDPSVTVKLDGHSTKGDKGARPPGRRRDRDGDDPVRRRRAAPAQFLEGNERAPWVRLQAGPDVPALHAEGAPRGRPLHDRWGASGCKASVVLECAGCRIRRVSTHRVPCARQPAENDT